MRVLLFCLSIVALFVAAAMQSHANVIDPFGPTIVVMEEVNWPPPLPPPPQP